MRRVLPLCAALRPGCGCVRGSATKPHVAPTCGQVPERCRESPPQRGEILPVGRSQHRIWLVAGTPASCQMPLVGSSPHPLLRHKVRCACNALRERAFHAPLPCSSVPNKTRFAGLLFGRGKRKIRRKDEKRQTIQHSDFRTGFGNDTPKSSTSPYEPERLCDRVLSRKTYRHS